MAVAQTAEQEREALNTGTKPIADAHRFDEGKLAQRLDAWFSRHFETHDARLHNALGTHPE